MQLPLNPLAGVAMFPEHGDDAGSLIRRAFIAQESEEAQHRHLAFYQPHRDPYSKGAADPCVRTACRTGNR